jgi:serine/threonine protein kinase
MRAQHLHDDMMHEAAAILAYSGMHPHVTWVYGYVEEPSPGGEASPTFGVVMPLMVTSLYQRLCKGPRLAPQHAQRIMLQVASEASFLKNSRGALHLSLKSSNVLLDAGCNAYMADLASAEVRRHHTLVALSHPTHRRRSGTLAWMAPELLEAMGGDLGIPASQVSDVYALAVLL